MQWDSPADQAMMCGLMIGLACLLLVKTLDETIKLFLKE